MTDTYSSDYIAGLVNELRKLPSETEWVEFKHNNAEPSEIGEYISALSNSAAMMDKTTSYMVWGVDDKTHEIIGTVFDPNSARVGNEELENWLLQRLSPKIHFRFFHLDIEGKQVILLEIAAAFQHPVKFQQIEFIRVGSYKKKLKDFSEKRTRVMAMS